MIKDLTPRLYQQTILGTCTEKNTLVVLPTGMGKSIVFVLLAANRLTHYPNSKILILAPTKPLCEQHVTTLKKFLEREDIVLFTGAVSPEKREKLFEEHAIIVSTPQGLENDIVSKRIDLKNISLMVFDECHRAVKDYAYVWIAQQYHLHSNYPRILGLTASPGSEEATIQEVMKNLFIEAVEVRTDDDPDVKPYIQEVAMEYVDVELSETLKKAQKYLQDFLKDRAAKLKATGLFDSISPQPTRRHVLGMQAQLQGMIAKGEKDFDILRALSVLAEMMKISHAGELLETQGLHALKLYFDQLEEDSRKSKTKAVQNIVQDLHYRSARILIESLLAEGKEHPKFEKLLEVLSLKEGEKAIVFNQYRDNAAKIVATLNEHGIKTALFVGQAKKKGTGLSQKEQRAMIDDFSEGTYQALVMTSVGEEGLDIPKVDHVVFFEPVPSAIRHIQRRGRTGRLEKGSVKVLVAKGTRDEGNRWSSFHKEKKMLKHLKTLQTQVVRREQKTLEQFENITLHADHREKTGRVVKLLIEQGVNIELHQLEVADYVISEEIGVEMKTVPDFINSLVDGRLLEQVKDLKYNFKHPVLLLEGEEDLYSVRNIHPNAIRGMLAAITVTFGIPIIPTKSPQDSAAMLIAIAKKEQQEKKSFSPRPTKRGISLKEQQEFFVGSLPDTGLKTAQELLKHFKNPKNIVNASEEELKEIEKIGKEKAAKYKKLFEEEY